MSPLEIGNLSLGQWQCVVEGFAKANGDNKTAPPSDEEFDAAVLAARGVQ